MDMSKYTDLRDGRSIIRSAQTDLAAVAAELANLVAADEFPNEHRSRRRRELNAKAVGIRADATTALNAWSANAVAEARRDLAANDVGTAAEESPRVAIELKVGRLVSSAR